MTSRAVALLGDFVVGVSSRLSFMRLLCDLSTVIPFSRRITYGADVCSSDVIYSCYKVSVNGDAAVLNIGENGMGIFLMVPRVRIS